jgi:hypothetical protein
MFRHGKFQPISEVINDVAEVLGVSPTMVSRCSTALPGATKAELMLMRSLSDAEFFDYVKLRGILDGIEREDPPACERLIEHLNRPIKKEANKCGVTAGSSNVARLGGLASMSMASNSASRRKPATKRKRPNSCARS